MRSFNAIEMAVLSCIATDGIGEAYSGAMGSARGTVDKVKRFHPTGLAII